MNKKKCFVVMPFSKTTDNHTEEYWSEFYSILEEIMQNNDYECKKSEIGPYNIFSNIIESIKTADIVIAVLTDYNANVWYELGIRHTLKNGTIMLLQKDQTVPFDIKSHGIILYEDSLSLGKYLQKEILNYLVKINSNTCDSPVLDSLRYKKSCNIDYENTKINERLSEMEKLLWKIVSEKSEHSNQNNNATKYNRILWVDDYPNNNSTIMYLFEKRNVHFDIAINTQQGIERFKNESYNMIITDMGRKNESDTAGITLIKELRKLNCNIPIVVFTSRSAVQKYGQTALEYGASIVSCNSLDIIKSIQSILDT